MFASMNGTANRRQALAHVLYASVDRSFEPMPLTITCKIPRIEVTHPGDSILPQAFVYPSGGFVLRNTSDHTAVASCTKYDYEDGTGLRALDYSAIRPREFVLGRSNEITLHVTTLEKMAIPIPPPPPPKTLEEMRNEQIENFLSEHPGLERSDLKTTSCRVEHRFETTVNGKRLRQGAIVAVTIQWVLFDDHTFYGPQSDGDKLQAEAQHRREFMSELLAASDQKQFLAECEIQLRELEQEVAAYQQVFQAQLEAAPDKRAFLLESRQRPFQPKSASGRDGDYWNVRRDMIEQFRIVQRPDVSKGHIDSMVTWTDRMMIERIVPVEQDGQV